MRGSSDFDPYHRNGRADGFERVGERILDFLRSRTADHWLMFVAGIVVGMIVG
jgi:hypothetical protein